jgi:CRISPR-associated endonuclease/helicase Cas3
MSLAHTGGPGGRGHDLVDHLRDVASRARRFAERARSDYLDFAAMAEWAGWLHDLGKYRAEFQLYLQGRRPGGTDTQHAVFGAARAAKVGLPCAVAMTILGHHAGLPKLAEVRGRIQEPSLDPLGVAEELAKRLFTDLGSDGSWPPQVREFLGGRRGVEATNTQELLIRMLFSCLVDADYLDTEVYMVGKERVTTPLQAGELFRRLDQSVQKLAVDALPTPINQSRSALYAACVATAERPPGIFRLTAPTGSGKTLAMLAFALKHAELRGLDRVIVVLPFLAIIEQNARVYREALGAADDPGVLVEHHSAVLTKGDETGSGETESADWVRAKQATENWDAPVIVTTAVQFLESLFARRPSACRKLHNIARSVVVFDEVQTLPFPLLDPILSAVRDLRDKFGVSFLLGSATQPRLERSTYLPNGLETEGRESHEIVADRAALFSVFRRAALTLPCLTEPPWSWDDLAQRVKLERQALIIVNLRKHSQDLFDRLKTAKVPGLFHLSSTMCAGHREEKLGRKNEPTPGTIYDALKKGDPCVVVSTQVVEAGVDLDFPVVFRAVAPLDAIIQAAGRCDREGRLTRAAGRLAGRVIVFRPAAEPATPPGYYQTATTKALAVLEEHAADPQCLLDDPEHFARYHQGLIALGEGHDRSSKIQAARKKLDYPEVADLFRVIDDAGQGVVVQYGDAHKTIEAIQRRQYVSFDDRRALQRFTVNLYPTWVARLQTDLKPVINREGAPLMYIGNYDNELGIRLGELPPETYCQ